MGKKTTTWKDRLQQLKKVVDRMMNPANKLQPALQPIRPRQKY
jgi:hypothetical protein